MNDVEKLRGTLIRLSRTRDVSRLEALGRIGAKVGEAIRRNNALCLPLGPALLLGIEHLRDLRNDADSSVRTAASAAHGQITEAMRRRSCGADALDA